MEGDWTEFKNIGENTLDICIICNLYECTSVLVFGEDLIVLM